MSALMFPADPFDAWDEHDFREWQSCQYLSSLWDVDDHRLDALRYMFAAMDEDEIKTVTGFTRVITIPHYRMGKSIVQQAMLDQARLTGAIVSTIGGATYISFDHGEMRFENIEDREFYGIDPGTEIATWHDSDGLYRGPDIETFEIVPEPTLPKRVFAPKEKRHTHPRSPRDTMRATRGR